VQIHRSEHHTPDAAVPEKSAISSPIAQALRQRKEAVSLALVDSVANWDKYAAEITDQDSRREFARREMAAMVDYLVTYLGSGGR
jgi:hypothetical protein